MEFGLHGKTETLLSISSISFFSNYTKKKHWYQEDWKYYQSMKTNRIASKRNDRKDETALKKVAIAISVILYILIMAGFIYVLFFRTDTEPEQTIAKEDNFVTTEVSKESTQIINLSDSQRIEQVSASLLKQTVLIQATYEETTEEMIKTTTEDGSGILFDQDDSYIYLVTNHHVIEHAQQIQVTFNNQIVKKGEIVGFDEFYDIAVLRVPLDETISSEIELAFFGNSDYIHLGEMVVAIGNALGHGQSVTVGYVSALNREVEAEEGNTILLQTDAAINPGNSGGALANLNGEIVGMNVSKYSEDGVERMSFAIPINQVIETVSKIMNKNYYPSENIGSFGIYGLELSEKYKDSIGYTQGIYLTRIQEDSIASQAGFQVGDILVELQGTTVSTFQELNEILDTTSDTLEVQYLKKTGDTYQDTTMKIQITQ